MDDRQQWQRGVRDDVGLSCAVGAAAHKTLCPLHVFGAFEHVCEESHGGCCGGYAFAELAHGKFAYGSN